MTRNRKIARLPRTLRDQINQRLENGEPGEPLLASLAWLNPLPEVQTVLQEQFAGIPISQQNLSDWRHGGCVEWELKRGLKYDAEESIVDSGELDPTPAGCLAGHLAARYVSLIRHWDGEPAAEFRAKVKALGAMIQNIFLLRRWDHNAAKLHLAQEQQEDQRKKSDREALAKQIQREEGTLPMRKMVQNLAQAAVPSLKIQTPDPISPSSSVKPSQGSLHPMEPRPPIAAASRQSAADSHSTEPSIPQAEVPASSVPDPKTQTPDPNSPSRLVKVSQG